jgi:ABC-type amino acid transport substrate-binding protein
MIYYCGKPVKTLQLLFWKEIPATITKIEDVAKRANSAICVEPASAADDFLSTIPNITKKPITALADLLLELQCGKSLCALFDPEVGERYKKQLPDLQILQVPLPEAFWTFGNGIAVARDNRDLAGSIEKIIEEAKRTSILQKLEQKWGV